MTDYNKKYLKYKAKYFQLKKQENKFIMNGGSNKILYLFKADWCPHCTVFKPTWEKLKDKLETKVKFVVYDADKDGPTITKFGVSGFPTLILKDGDKSIEYVGPKDQKSVEDFIINN